MSAHTTLASPDGFNVFYSEYLHKLREEQILTIIFVFYSKLISQHIIQI